MKKTALALILLSTMANAQPPDRRTFLYACAVWFAGGVPATAGAGEEVKIPGTLDTEELGLHSLGETIAPLVDRKTFQAEAWTQIQAAIRTAPRGWKKVDVTAKLRRGEIRVVFEVDVKGTLGEERVVDAIRFVSARIH